MKRLTALFLCILSISGFTLNSSAQVPYYDESELRALFHDNPGFAGGTMRQYPDPVEANAPVPKGYKAIYISHYGRHGSRFETKSEPYDAVHRFLSAAHADSVLTAFGEDIYKRFETIYPSLMYTYGDLTLKGQAQHRRIAKRMVKGNGSLLKGRTKVYASSSIVPRCVISMMSFLDELRTQNPKLEFSFSATMPDMYYNALVYPDRLTSEDKERMKKSQFISNAYKWAHADIDTKPFFLRLCKNIDYVESHGGIKVAEAFWHIAANAQCLDSDVSFDDLYTEDERFYLWRNSNIGFALMVGRIPPAEGLLPEIAQSLLGQILDQADEDLASGEVAARLRFGHDGIIAPLMSLLGIEGWTEIANSPEEIPIKIHSFDVPMASNFQLVFYRNRKGDILVRAMYNERDQVLPLEDQSLAPYYKWDDFKAHYSTVCEKARKTLRLPDGYPIIL